MAGRRKQAWKRGDFFVVPLPDQSFALGQVIDHVPNAMDSALCVFSSINIKEVPIETISSFVEDDVISIQFVTRDLLDSGKWKVVGNGAAYQADKHLNLEALKMNKYIGVDIRGSRNIEKFLGAFHALIPWDCLFEADYFDRLLVSEKRKPMNIIFK